MDQEQALRERLAAIATPPSRISMDTVLPAARQRVRRRRAVWAGAGAALTVGALLAVPKVLLSDAGPDNRPALPAATSAPVAHPAGCRPRTLPVPDGITDMEAESVDPTGRYIVGNATVKHVFRPVLWTDGVPRLLPVPVGSVQVTGVNASGVVVGLVNDGAGGGSVFRFEDGQYTVLGMPAGNWSPYPGAMINTAGDVLVNAEPATAGENNGKGTIVLLWKAGATTPVRLPLPAGATVDDLADDGTMVGGLYRDGAGVAGYRWDQRGGARKLSAPAGKVTLASASRGDWVTGSVWGQGEAARWNLRTGEFRQFPQRFGPGIAVNDDGWVVTQQGALIRDGAVADLPVGGGGRTAKARALTDDGLVVGSIAVEPEAGRSGSLAFLTASGQTLPQIWQC
ncbi:hypothetical protein [Actinoplanes awajinensis]|uniref:Uncharacterized protein n=1 Tax=Actinoplanes awajinensis subsp. mycoplanecinus TaxID=135947 RepID=A0A101JTX4_9ACTN|nr:hypothetical protein [Actinoplanes awajinensis]KUL32643.1 hypothetical protein ADL15_19195 [Actinoplanes awajinensis subsp. mycoplanecinus]